MPLRTCLPSCSISATSSALISKRPLLPGNTRTRRVPGSRYRMTKYILVGGNDLRSDNYGSQLAQEVYESVEARPVRVLSCLFATPLEFQSIAAETWRPWFIRHFGKDVVWSYALPEQFEE